MTLNPTTISRGFHADRRICSRGEYAYAVAAQRSTAGAIAHIVLAASLHGVR